MASELFQRALTRALDVLHTHDAVAEIQKTEGDSISGPARVHILMEVALPNAWKAEGCSPNGVKRYEPICLDFPTNFPTTPPEVSLREDFGRENAHIQPWTAYPERPVPCVVDGPYMEFYYQQGLAGILNQLVIWLENAAEGKLIDPEQGWEPVRRDTLGDFLVADSELIRPMITKSDGYCFLKYDYVRVEEEDSTVLLHGQLQEDRVKINPTNISKLIKERDVSSGNGYWFGDSLALLIWPKSSDVSDSYMPDTVSDIGSLKELADRVGCLNSLNSGLSWLEKCIADKTEAGPFSLAIVLCIRRPFCLIGTNSPIELCPYFVDFRSPTLFADGGKTRVAPASHRHRLNNELMARMSGMADLVKSPHWLLVGAGSLGSKIALHLARAGLGPGAIVDSRSMSPHNFVRHALLPPPSAQDRQLYLLSSKAQNLSDALSGFGNQPKPIRKNIITALQDRGAAAEIFPENTWLAINCTASLAVREAFSAASNENLLAPVSEAIMYSEGRIGLVLTEGPNRNPNLNDLIAEFYSVATNTPRLQELMFADTSKHVVRASIGEGCGSLTMPMTDGRISLFSAGMAEYYLAKIREGLPDSVGELAIGVLQSSGMGVDWEILPLKAVTQVKPSSKSSWKIHLHETAKKKIESEVALYPSQETGGVLLGCLSEGTETFNIVDVLPAPEDSVRSASEFILGKKGLARALKEYSERSGWSLFCLGTWHSHLAPSGPSSVDKKSAQAIAVARLKPSVLLIHTPAGYQAEIADSATLEG